MEISQPSTDLPLLKLPFTESVQQLHRYNLHVAQVCLTASQSQLQAYHQNKLRYEKEAQQREEHQTKALEEAEEAKRKSVEARQREGRRRNQENLAKIQHFMAERRNKLTKKERQLMEESSARRENYLQGLAGSFHHSQDRRSRMKLRQENELQRSLLLLQQNQEKVRVANERKIELLQEIKNAIKQKNQEDCAAAIENSRQQQTHRQELELHRLVLKYGAADKHLSGMESLLEKRAADKRKEEEKSMEKHRKKRSDLHEECLRKIEEDGKKDQAKIDKALFTKYQHLETSVSAMESKRKQRQRQLMYNTFYLQEEAEKRSEAILHKHHTSQVNLASSKAMKERMHSSNLMDSFRATLRS